MQSIDLVLTLLQTPLKTDIYMKPPKVPKEFDIPYLPKFDDRFIYSYKLLKNLYFVNCAVKTWCEYLKHCLINWVWSQSSIDECIFTKNGVILVIYVDDAILITPSKQNINFKITLLMKYYNQTDKGE